MAEMVARVALWLHQHRATDDNVPLASWSDLDESRKAALRSAAEDLILTMRRPTLEMRAYGRAALIKGEGEVWRAMIDGSLKDG